MPMSDVVVGLCRNLQKDKTLVQQNIINDLPPPNVRRDELLSANDIKEFVKRIAFLFVGHCNNTFFCL
jgi:septum formation inhibitor-activating ATPase MinD